MKHNTILVALYTAKPCITKRLVNASFNEIKTEFHKLMSDNPIAYAYKAVCDGKVLINVNN